MHQASITVKMSTKGDFSFEAKVYEDDNLLAENKMRDRCKRANAIRKELQDGKL